jgi:hypothetical protein
MCSAYWSASATPGLVFAVQGRWRHKLCPTLGFSEGETRTLTYWGVPYGTLLFSSAKVTGRASNHAARQGNGAIAFGIKIPHLRYVGMLTRVLQSRYGAGLTTLPPSKERRPGLLFAPIHTSAWKGVPRSSVACRLGPESPSRRTRQKLGQLGPRPPASPRILPWAMSGARLSLLGLHRNKKPLLPVDGGASVTIKPTASTSPSFCQNRVEYPFAGTPARPDLRLFLFGLESGDEHLFGPLGGLQVVLEHGTEELDELLVALRLGVLHLRLE